MSLKSLSTLAIVAVVTALFLWLGASQLEAPRSHANTGFDQARAFEVLSRLWAEEQPHVAGSPLNIAIRERIRSELIAYGYDVKLQSAFQCAPKESRFAGCTKVENVIAVHKGSRPGKALLATAHYDSVWAGPGVGDDGAGTAIVLDFAREIAKRQTKNDVIFLITDGEETGLRGAYAFAERHPLMKDVGLILNFEARGTSGPSLMFETGPGNAKLIDLYASTVHEPYANSLLYEIYRLMPNDTDFSVYRRAGYTGFNFAYTGSGALYHSERDNLANLNRDTLQHHGDNLFALGTVLADADLAALKSTSDASYFDLFGRTMVVWPASLNLPLALIALIAIAALIFVHRSSFSLRAVAFAAGGVIATPFLLFAVGWLLSFPLGVWPGVHPIDHAHPWPARIAVAAAVIATAMAIAALIRQADKRAVTLIAGLVLALFAVLLAALVTGASYFFWLPAVAFAISGWIETRLRRDLSWTPWVTFGLIAFFWLPLFPRLDLVLSFALTHFKILALTPFVWALTPPLVQGMPTLRSDLLFTAVVAAFALVWSLIAAQTPAYAVNHPRGLNVVYWDDRAAKPRWLIEFVGAPDEAYLKATGFPATDEPYLRAGIVEAKGRMKPALDLQLEAPSFTVQSAATFGADRVIKGVLRPGRGGLQLAFGAKPNSGVRAIRVAGQELAGPTRFSKTDPTLAFVLGWGAQELPVEFVVDPAAKPSLILLERSALPKSGETQALLAARPRDAAPAHFGNATTVIVKVDLEAAAHSAAGGAPAP